jgi:prepilin-type N-terminal cleavage/methylation domain-containing protein
MILSKKKVFSKRKFPGFTLIEVIVSLVIIGIAAAGTAAVFSSAVLSYSHDEGLEKALDFSNEYLSRLSLNSNPLAILFSEQELSNIASAQKFPVLLQPLETNIAGNIKILINRKIHSILPLLADVGIEALIYQRQAGKKARHYWVETTFSEEYLKKWEE